MFFRPKYFLATFFKIVEKFSSQNIGYLGPFVFGWNPKGLVYDVGLVLKYVAKHVLLLFTSFL